jgi:hypothetical protein
LKEQDASHDQENQDPQRAAPLSMAKNRKGARVRSSGPRRSPSVLSVLRTPNGTRKVGSSRSKLDELTWISDRRSVPTTQARRAESSSESDDEPTAQLQARTDALGQSAHSKNNVSGSEHGACQNGEDSSNWIQVGSDFYPAANPTSSKSQESTSCERAGKREAAGHREAAGQRCEGVAGLLQRWKSPSVTRQANVRQEAPFFEALEAAKPQYAGGFADAESASSSTDCQAVDGEERAATRPVARVLAVAPPTSSRLSSSSSKTAEKGQGEDGWNDTHGLKSTVDRLLKMDACEMSRSVRSAFKRFCTSPAALKSVAIHVADAIGCLLTRSASHLKQQEGAKRVRELCRFQRATKGGRGGGDVEIDGIEWSIIDIVVEREESLSTLAAMLARQCQAARPSKAGDCACDACSGRNAAAACAQHLALDDYVARCALATSRTFIASLAVALASHGYREACHRVAACIANLALEHNDLRDLICSNQDILTGLENLFSNSDQQSIDFSLAALANLSIDPRQAQRLIRHVRMDKVVVVLAAGSTKSQHRGAGLIRNLLFSKESIETISRVDGIVQALERLKSSPETCSETRTRATVALSMIKANPETRGVSGAGLEMKLFYGRSGHDNKDREGSQTNDVEIDEGDSCEMYRDEASNLDADLNTLCIVPLIEDSKQQQRDNDGQSSKDKRAKQEESDDATQRQRLFEQQKQFQQMAEILRAKKSKTTGPARDEQRSNSEQKFEGGTETRSEHLDQRGDVSSRPGGLAATPNVEAVRNLTPREPATELCVSELTMGCAMTPSNLNQGLSKSQHQQPLPQSQIPRLALSPSLGPYKLPVQIIQSPSIITTSNLQRGNLSVPATPRSQGTPSLHARLPRSNSLSSNVLDKRQDNKAGHYVPARRASHELPRTSTFSSPSPRHFDTQSLEQQRTGYQFFLNADQRMGGRPQPRDGSISDVAKECGEQNFSDKESPSVQEQVSEKATSKSLPLKWFGLSKYVV